MFSNLLTDSALTQAIQFHVRSYRFFGMNKYNEAIFYCWLFHRKFFKFDYFFEVTTVE